MSDPTPEERAQTAMDGMFDLATIEFSIADQIRAAVEAERERCARVVEDLITYLAEAAIKAKQDVATAIRKGPDAG